MKNYYLIIKSTFYKFLSITGVITKNIINKIFHYTSKIINYSSNSKVTLLGLLIGSLALYIAYKDLQLSEKSNIPIIKPSSYDIYDQIVYIDNIGNTPGLNTSLYFHIILNNTKEVLMLENLGDFPSNYGYKASIDKGLNKIDWGENTEIIRLMNICVEYEDLEGKKYSSLSSIFANDLIMGRGNGLFRKNNIEKFNCRDALKEVISPDYLDLTYINR